MTEVEWLGKYAAVVGDIVRAGEALRRLWPEFPGGPCEADMRCMDIEARLNNIAHEMLGRMHARLAKAQTKPEER